MKAVFLVCVISFSFLLPFGYAQKGPGGVSQETTGPANSNNKLWLDAGSIVSSDGISVPTWSDESLSQNVNNATQSTVSLQPIYKSDPSATINGNPVLRFGGGRRFLFLTADDINNSGPYTERTTIVAFRTSNDVTSRQILYEQGGTVRGLNIYIFNGELYLGGYDLAVDGDGTPSWGFVSTKTAVSPNTVYVISQVFYGPLASTAGFIKGYLNGVQFSPIATGVGSLATHPDPPGMGAVNSDTYVDTGAVSANGTQPFLGDIAEFIAYEDTLNDAERIIVENYLSAKYFANLVVNDRYEWQLDYGSDVIGIGQESGALSRHNTSQGRNIFEIEGTLANFDSGDYFLIGHNASDIASWTTSRAPNNGVNVQRLNREWKVDHTGNIGDIDITLDITGLPALPTGYSKYGIAIDSSKGITSNFNSAGTYIVELTNTSGSLYEASLTVPDSSYATIVAIETTVGFSFPSSNIFETDVNFSTSVEARLNFVPATANTINFSVTNNTALLTADYDNVSPMSGVLTFSPGSATSNVSFDIVGDLVPESTEDFRIDLTNGAGSTPGLIVTGNTQNVFTIYDNDNTPKIGLEFNTSSALESAGNVFVRVVRSGDNVPTVSCQYRLRVAGGSGTADPATDFTFSAGTLTFASGQTLDSIPVTLLVDLLDESTETVIIELLNISVGADFETGKVEHTLSILDDTPEPTIAFTSTSLGNGETVGSPTIEVTLSALSDKDVTVQYVVTGASTATNGTDFTLGSPGILTISAGSLSNTIPLFVVSDALVEPTETIVIELLDNASLTNASLGSDSILTYSIEDYVPFEFTGTGGVGTTSDNIFWFTADSVSGAQGAVIDTLIDQSANTNGASAASGQRALLQVTSNALNGHRVLRFDGVNDFYTIPNDALINTPPASNPATSRFIFVTFRTGSDVSNRQVIYEQGGATRGINIYIESNQIFFSAWNNNFDNSDATTPWGGTGANAKVVSGGVIATGTAYVATLVYDFNATNQLEGFLNGSSVGAISDGSIGRLYSHGDAVGVGGISGGSLFSTAPTGTANTFTGDIAEIIYYGNAPVNESRRRIVENYLAGKYGVTITNQYYSYGATHGHEIAGIGRINPSHLDSKGSGLIRMNNPSSMEAGEFLMWGHNNSSLDLGEIGDTPFTINNRMTRVWRADGAGDVGNVIVRFDLSNFVVNAESDLELLIDGDGTFITGATQHTAGRSYDPVSKIVTFTDVDLDPGDFFTMGSNSFLTPLPIELVNFDATLEGDQVIITWETLSEINNSHFDIERSRDALNFENLATLIGAGKSNEPISYRFADENPFDGISYYRLKQTDFNGAFSYSDIAAINRPVDPGITIFPNPTRREIYLRYLSLPDDANLSVKIYDLTGNIVLSSSVVFNESKTVKLELPNQITPGLYTVRIGNDQGVFHRKIIVQ